MNIKTVANSYSLLSPKERFQLIVAAGARGDQPEQDRLRTSAKDIKLSVPDHSPWAQAFHELAMMTFLEILDESAKHRMAHAHWCDAEDEAETVEGDEDEATDESDDTEPTSEDEDESPADHWFNLYMAQGFILRTKIAGWRLFCERLNLPPFAAWQFLPGYERFQITVAMVEDNKFRRAPMFSTEGMVRWLSRIRPKGEPAPREEDLLSPERFADELDGVFRQRATWWGGS